MCTLTNDEPLELDYEDFQPDDLFEEPGEETARTVYGIDKDRVAKVSNGMDGSWQQNRNEKKNWDNAADAQKEYLAPIIDGNDNVVIMRSVMN